jgi:hypothetical protein
MMTSIEQTFFNVAMATVGIVLISMVVIGFSYAVYVYGKLAIKLLRDE